MKGNSLARRERYLVGLDVGTSRVTTVVGESMDDGTLDVVGIGVAESRGIKRGVVVNVDAAVDSIKKAIEEAELMAGVEIDSVHLALSGPHIKGFNSRGVIAVAGKNREITRDDVRRAIDAAKAVALPTGREILHVLPQDFVVDEQDGIGAPVGMTGARLEVNVHIVTGAVSSTQNLIARRILSEILQPRAEEIFHLVWDEIRRAGYEKALNSGIVLTGGGSILEGMPEIAEQIFDLPIRRGAPMDVGGLADHVSSPTFATPVGLVLYAHRNREPDAARAGAGAFGRMAGRLRGIFKEFG